LKYEDYINSLDERYLEDDEEVDQEDMSTEEHLIKMKDFV